MKARELKAKDSRVREQTILTLIKMRIKHRGDSALKFVNRSLAKIVGTINLLTLILAFSLQSVSAAEPLTIDGGGGTSSGGDFEVTGTIGTVQNGPVMSGGDIEATGQIVAMSVTVPTPDGTVLTISTDGNNVVLSWPSDGTPFILEQTTNLASGNWTTVNASTVDDGLTLTVTVPAISGSKFFRLRSP